MKNNKRQGIGSLFLTVEFLIVISLWRTCFGIPSIYGAVQSEGSLSAPNFVTLFKSQQPKGHTKPSVENGEGRSESSLEASYTCAPPWFCSIVFPEFVFFTDTVDKISYAIPYAYCDAARAPPHSIVS